MGWAEGRLAFRVLGLRHDVALHVPDNHKNKARSLTQSLGFFRRSRSPPGKCRAGASLPPDPRSSLARDHSSSLFPNPEPCLMWVCVMGWRGVWALFPRDNPQAWSLPYLPA